jgi:hypothetical protein
MKDTPKMKQGEGGLMVFDDVTSLNPSWNNADWVVLVILVAFLALGLLFGAAKLGARIIGYPVAVLGSMVLANVVLPYLYPMGWYQSVISALWNNKTLVNWLFYILLAIRLLRGDFRPLEADLRPSDRCGESLAHLFENPGLGLGLCGLGDSPRRRGLPFLGSSDLAWPKYAGLGHERP